MLKRIFIIFLISLGSLVGVVGVAMGVKYLTGEFNEKIVAPEDVFFEQNDYFFDGTKTSYTVTVQTTTEEVTQKEVSLYFEKASAETRDKMHWTDGNIIIPKTVYLGKEFTIEIVKDKSHTELGDMDWVHGGISKIIASSANKMINPSTARILVDVPVYSTELVIYNKEMSTENLSFDTISKNIENSSLATALSEGERVDVRAGDTFYVGVNYYPYASAFKYSQASSTNILYEYKNNIASSLGVSKDEVYGELNELFANRTNIIAKDILNAYEDFINGENVSRIINGLETQFKNGLKYNKLTEKLINDDSLVEIVGKIKGTNVYKVRAKTDLENVDFYTYVFKSSAKEDEILRQIALDGNELNLLEDCFVNGSALRTVSGVNIKEVEVNTILVRGNLQRIYPDRLHTIYATKSGINNRDQSYLNILLSNSNVENVDLQDKASNLGIRFQKRSGATWVDATLEEISFNGDYETRIDTSGKTYYLPIGDVPSWVIYANNYISNDFRASIKYFIDDDIIAVDEDKLPRLSLVEITSRTENMISWTDTSNIELQVIDISGITGDTSTVYINPEFDLTTITDFDTVNSNVYTTVKYFIYTDDTAFNSDEHNSLGDYFNTKEQSSKIYTFLADGSVKNLYELSSSVLKIKDTANIPNISIKVIYATIKTNAVGREVTTQDGLYDIVKYSAIKEGSVERLSGVEIVCSKSLKNLTGTFTIKDIDNAAVFADISTVKVAQNKPNVLRAEVTANGATENELNGAYLNEQITVVATTGNLVVDTNRRFISVDGIVARDGKIIFDITTKSVLIDEDIKLFVSYTVSGRTFLFAVNYQGEQQNQQEPENPDNNNSTISKITIISDTRSTGSFALTNASNADELLDLSILDKINVQTKYENSSFVTVYSYVYTNEDPEEEVNASCIFNEGIIRVTIINFLDRDVTRTYPWELVSSNPLVATIGSDNHSITFNSVGEAIITLKVDGDVQKQIMFNVTNSGYISKTVINDDSRNEYTETFNLDKVYVNGTKSLTVTKGNDGVTNLNVVGENSKNIFEMYYTLGENQNIKLNFTIKIADEDSLNRFIAITGEDEITLDTSLQYIKLNKTLGDGVTIHLKYVYEKLQIVQNIALYFRPTIEREDLIVNKYDIVDDGEGHETAVVGDEITLRNGRYELYAETGYVFTEELHDDSDDYSAYFYVQNEAGEFVNDGLFVQIDESQTSFRYGPVSKNTIVKIFVSNNDSGIEVGDFQYSFEVLIRPNIKLKNTAVDVVLDIDGSKIINIASELVERVVGAEGDVFGDNFSIKQIQFRYLTPTNIGAIIHTEDGMNINLSFSGNAIINQYCIISFILSYNNYDLDVVNLTIYPYNFESILADRITYYRGEKAIILVVGDEIARLADSYLLINNDKYHLPIIDSQFESVEYSDKMYPIIQLSDFGAYTRGDVDNKTVWAQNNNLITETNIYLSVLDANGNLSKYRIIISQMDVPFINYNPEAKVNDIDLYKLLFGYSGVDLKEYYEDLDIVLGDDVYYGGDVIEIFGNLYTFVMPDDIDKEKWNIRATLVDMPNENVSDYIIIDRDLFTIAAKQLGFDIYVQVYLDVRNGNYVYTIPTIVKICRSQKLLVNYPYSDREIPETYGTDEYDQGMLSATSAFNNIEMEYSEFDINGQAKYNLNNGQFIVQQKVGDNYETVQYDGNYIISIASVSVNLNGAWEFISSSNHGSYVSINESNLLVTINKNGAIGIRVKLEIRTQQGNSKNYYYLQAGEIPQIVLLKKSGGASATDRGVSVNYNDQINLVKDGVLTFKNGAVLAGNYNYYLASNNDKLNYKVMLNGVELTGDSLAFFFTQNLEQKTLTTNLVPNGQTIQIVPYTIYGVVQTITVNILPYYDASLKTEEVLGVVSDIKVYSGVIYDVSELINIVLYETENAVTGYSLIVPETTQEQENIDYYTIMEVTGNPRIVFAHSRTAYTIPTFSCNVEIDGKVFAVKINNLEVLPSITSKSVNGRAVTIKDKYGESTETVYFNTSSGNITLPSSVWQQLFEIVPGSKTGLTYSYIYNAVEKSVESTADIQISVGSIIANQAISVTFKISCEYNDQTIEITTLGSVNIVPEYTVTINYPQPNAQTSYSVEYVQIGAELDFADENFNHEDRIQVERISNHEMIDNYSLEIVSDNITLATITDKKYTFDSVGSYEIRVIIDNIAYGVYNIIVDTANPFGVNTSKIDGKTFYVGYGDDNPLNYVDIEFYLPSAMPGLETGSKFSVYTDAYSEPILKDVYYRSGDQTKKFRVAILLSDYVKGVTAQNIHVSYEYEGNSGLEVFEAPCRSVVISRRFTISYNGQEVDSLYYSNIINASGITKVSTDTDNNIEKYSYQLDFSVDSVSTTLKTLSGASYEYFVTADIVVGNINVNADYDILLNANQYLNGLSFVDLFYVKDSLDKDFWYNHVGDMGGVLKNSKKASISITYVSSHTMVNGNLIEYENKAMAVRLEQRTFGTGTNAIVYDYFIKAMGATNNGTIVKLQVEYKVGDFSYKKDIRIKVMSDIEYSILNNDGTNTQNSANNPYTMSGTATITLCIANQTNENNQLYFVYAWGKYSDDKKNIAQSLNIDISGDWTSHCGVSARNSAQNRLFNVDVDHPPEFGDKSISLTFEDEFGFAFVYHIKLIAPTKVENVRNTQTKVYEGDSITISKNGATGIIVSLTNNADFTLDGVESIKATKMSTGQKTELVGGLGGEGYLDSSNHSYYVITVSGDSLVFNQVPQPFWIDYGNGSSVNLSVKIAIKKDSVSEETTLISVEFALTRRFEYQVKEENTYIRDGIKFELANLVSVYDNKNGYYLGEPELIDVEALKVEFSVSENIDIQTFNNQLTYKYNGTENSYIIDTSGGGKLSLKALMIGLETYVSTKNEIAPTTDLLDNALHYVKKIQTAEEGGGTVPINDIDLKEGLAHEILSKFGITIITNTINPTEVEGYYIDLLVKAKNKYNGNEVMSTNKFIVKSFDSDDPADGVIDSYKTISGNEANFIVLGETSDINEFRDINLLNYNFELYQPINIICENVVKIGSDPGASYCFVNGGASIEQMIVKKLNVAIADLPSATSVKVILKLGTNTQLKYERLTDGKRYSILLCEDEYTQAANIELFTGYYTETGSVGSEVLNIYSGSGDKIQAFNGLSIDDVKYSKMLHSIDTTLEEQTICLRANGEFYTDTTRNVDYQSRSDIELEVTYRNSTYTYSSTETFRVTLKYTGIDSSRAYTGTYTLYRVNINSSYASSITNGVVNSTIPVDLNSWSNAFDLIPGVGKMAILANAGGEDLSIFGNSGETDSENNKYPVLRFALKAVTNEQGQSTTNNNVVGIDETSGDIQLKNGFKLNEYYISIEISCRYPNKVEDGNLVQGNSRPIGTVYIGFTQ